MAGDAAAADAAIAAVAHVAAQQNSEELPDGRPDTGHDWRREKEEIDAFKRRRGCTRREACGARFSGDEDDSPGTGDSPGNSPNPAHAYDEARARRGPRCLAKLSKYGETLGSGKQEPPARDCQAWRCGACRRAAAVATHPTARALTPASTSQSTPGWMRSRHCRRSSSSRGGDAQRRPRGPTARRSGAVCRRRPERRFAFMKFLTPQHRIDERPARQCGWPVDWRPLRTRRRRVVGWSACSRR